MKVNSENKLVKKKKHINSSLGYLGRVLNVDGSHEQKLSGLQ